jgi:FkbM family methyltransferase
MKNLIKRILAVFSLEITILSKKSNYLRMGLDDNNSTILNDGKTIFLKDFGLEININSHGYIIKGLHFLYNLKNQINASFTFENNLFYVGIGDIKYNIQAFDQLYILNEVFIEGVYSIDPRENFELIDIGMNVGITSLFFAQQPQCTAIHAFEPFKLTYEQAVVNINLNTSFSSKICTYNYGLGKENKTITVTYDKDNKGSMGLNGIPAYLTGQSHEILNEHIIIKDAAEVLKPIITNINKSENQLILKMDCEGSEYDIFESLEDANYLSYFSFIILEWHYKNPDQIYRALEKNGFTFLTLNPASTAGMIYAFNNN